GVQGVERRSTPSPYTTLFRSQAVVQGCVRDAMALALGGRKRSIGFAQLLPVAAVDEDQQGGVVISGGEVVQAFFGRVAVVMRLQDRKSTRLNSSHVKI